MALNATTCRENSRDPLQTRNVIMITIDGPRYSETWGDSLHPYIPHMANDMAPQGCVFTLFHNDGYTQTTAGHTALITGVYQDINNAGLELPQNPSIFQIWRKESGSDSTKALIVTSKDKLEVLSNCQDTAWSNRYRPMRDCGISGLGSGNREDSVTLRKALEALSTQHPQLALIHFKEPDASAHANNWSKYLQEIINTDGYAYEIWQFLNSDDFYSGNTTLFITNDHGRHLDGVADGFVSHGDTCSGCRHINLYAYGPDFPKNTIIDDPYSQIDLTVTIADLMGFQLPNSQGRIIEPLYKPIQVNVHP